MSRKTVSALWAATSLALVLPITATAQTPETNEIVPLTDWTVDDLYADGVSVSDALWEMEVYGIGGEEIGDVENVLFGSDGRVLSIIAEVGGFWDIGDTHVNVPWADVELNAPGNSITVPVSEDTVDDFGLYPDEMISETEAAGSVERVDDDLLAGPRVWRATELIGDYVRLREDDAYANYGYVDDIIIRDGEIAAVLVRPSAAWGTPGVYGYPYYGYGYGWEPGAPNYDLPYQREDIEALEPVEYNRFE